MPENSFRPDAEYELPARKSSGFPYNFDIQTSKYPLTIFRVPSRIFRGPAAVPTSRRQDEQGRGVGLAPRQRQPRGRRTAVTVAAASRAQEAVAPVPGGGAGAAGDEAAVGRVPRAGHRDDRHQGRKAS